MTAGQIVGKMNTQKQLNVPLEAAGAADAEREHRVPVRGAVHREPELARHALRHDGPHGQLAAGAVLGDGSGGETYPILLFTGNYRVS